jgi:penicillin-binding protein 2
MARIKLLIWLVYAALLLLLCGMFNIEIVRGGNYQKMGDKNCIRLLSQRGSRGKVLDRDGRQIAGNKLSYDLMIIPEDNGLRDKAILQSSRVLGVSAQDLNERFVNGYISSSVPVTVFRNLKLEDAIALDQMKIDCPAIIVQPNPVRRYAGKGLACHLLGYLGQIDRWRLTKLEDYGYKTKDIVGFGGIEEEYDYYLRQEEGGVSFQVDHRGKFARTLGFKPPVNGKDVQLTIDLRLQKIAQDALGGKKGAVVIINPHSGEILVLASSPAFDPGAFMEEGGSAAARYLNDSDAPMINRAISAASPAGSVFKVVVAAAALENKKISRDTSFFCNGSLRVGRQEFRCWSTHGAQDITAAITHSCNVFFYRAGLLAGAGAMHDYALKFGFSRQALWDIPYAKAGFIPSPLQRKFNKFRDWYDGDTANLSIGQGDVLVTPLQVARMISVFANGGYLVSPYITKAIDGREMVKRQHSPQKLNLNAKTIEYIRQGLRGVVSDPSGTGNVLSGLGVSLAGKTGTAQAPPGQSHAWFCGFFPYDKPKYAICVFLEHGGPGYYSCLVAKEIIGKMIEQGLI